MIFWLIKQIYNGVTIVVPLLLICAAAWTLHRKRNKRVRAASLAGVALLLVAARIYATHIEPRRLVVRTAELRAPGPPLRIVHFSDIQTGAVGAWEDRVIARIVELAPDLVIHTGDLLQPVEPATIGSELPKITAALAPLSHLPMFTVEGDTDGWMNVLVADDVVAHMDLLRDRSQRLVIDGRSISILGLSLSLSAGGARPLIEAWLAALPATDLTIVMGHRPDFAMDLAGLDIDLALAGHTHGGQVRIPLLGPIITLSNVPRAWARGFRTIHDAIHLNVSAGIGAERAYGLPPIRMFCPPELTVIDVR